MLPGKTVLEYGVDGGDMTGSDYKSCLKRADLLFWLQIERKRKEPDFVRKIGPFVSSTKTFTLFNDLHLFLKKKSKGPC